MIDTAYLTGIDRILALDMETTGYPVKTPAEVLKLPRGLRLPGVIIQIGCIEVLRDGEGWRLGESWETLVNPDGPVQPASVAVHGISPARLKTAPRFVEVVQEFERMASDSVLLAHSAFNEIDFLNFEMRRAKLVAADAFPYSEDRFIDTQVMARGHFPGAPGSLDTLLDRLWIDRTDRFQHHGALLDAEMTAEAFIKMSTGFVQDATRSFSA